MIPGGSLLRNQKATVLKEEGVEGVGGCLSAPPGSNWAMLKLALWWARLR